MDKDRAPSSEVNPEQEFHRKIERTRQSISETVDEIKGELSQALDWQTYLRKYPEAFLIGGGALGFIIGRAITGCANSPNRKRVNEQAAATAFDGNKERSPQFSAEDSSIRRIIDMTASALLAQVVPIVSSKLRHLLGIPAVGDRSGDSPQKESWLH